MDGLRGPGSKFTFPLPAPHPTIDPSGAKLAAMHRTVNLIRDLVLRPAAPTFSWASNIMEQRHDPGNAERLRMVFATSVAAESATVGQESPYSAQFDLSLNVVGPQRFGINSPILTRERSFADSGLEHYPVKPLWKRRADRSDRPVPLGQLIARKEELVSTVPPVIEAVSFVPISAEGAPEEEQFVTQFEFVISARHATEFWVIREDEELIRRQLLMARSGGERQIQNIVEEGGEEVNRFFKADFVPNMTTVQADRTSLMRGHFIIIAIPIIGVEPPAALPARRGESLFSSLSFGRDLFRSAQIGEVSIGSGDRSGLQSKLVDKTQRDTSLLPRIIHLKLLGVREGQDVPLGQDIAGALEFPPLPN